MSVNDVFRSMSAKKFLADVSKKKSCPTLTKKTLVDGGRKTYLTPTKNNLDRHHKQTLVGIDHKIISTDVGQKKFG